MIAGIVLAAGSSTRMGKAKALLDAGGATFLGRLAGAMRSGGCTEIVAVIPSDDGEVAVEARRAGCRTALNPGGRGGQIASLRVGLAAVRKLERRAAATLFTPVDNPAVQPGTIRALIAAWRETGSRIVVPRCDGERGHPVLVDMAIAHEFDAPDLAEGARGVVRRDPGRVREVAVADRGAIDDLDTPERYRARFAQVAVAANAGSAGGVESVRAEVPGPGGESRAE